MRNFITRLFDNTAMLPLTVALLFSVVLPIALAQFVPAPTDLISTTGYANISVRYKEVVTGICELDPDVKSYSGYVDIEEDEHIFFWSVHIDFAGSDAYMAGM